MARPGTSPAPAIRASRTTSCTSSMSSPAATSRWSTRRGWSTGRNRAAHHAGMTTDPASLAPVPGFIDLRSRLRAGETLYGSFATLGSPVATEILARAGFDWLIVDLEHGAATEADLLANLLAIGTTRTAALVRVPSGERLRIGRALDLGAHGLMIPQMASAAEVAEAVSFMRYPPDGKRGLALSTRGAGLG